MTAYITALLVHGFGQHHFRRIRQRGVLGLALIMALLVLDLWDHTQQRWVRRPGPVKMIV